MRRFLKVTSIALTLIMLAASFTSCGNKKDSNKTSSEATSAPSQSSQPAKEAPVLKWLQIGGQPKDLNTVVDKMNEYSVGKIGVKCQYTYFDWGVWSDRVKAVLNSGEYFDIMFNNSDVYSSAVQMGAFADITSLLNDTPALKSFIPDGVWSGAKIKGKIYGVPTYKDSSQTQYWVWDKELAEKYSIDYKNIKTIAQMDAPLRTLQAAIKKGEIKDIKYAFYMTADGINGQFMNYDVVNACLGVRYDDKNVKVVKVLEQPEIMENFQYLYKWNKDGLINPDASTLKEGRKWVPVGSAQGWPGAEVVWANNSGRDVLINPWGGPIYSTATILGSINSIYSGSKYKAEALKYLELCNTDVTMRNTLAYGIEGVHYTKNSNGTITKDPVKKDDYSTAQYSQASFFSLMPVSPSAPDQWTKVKEWNGKAQNSVLLGFSFDKQPVKNELAACEAVNDKYKAELYTGASDPNVTVKKIYDEMEKVGLSKVKAELEKQIKDFLGK